MEIAAFILSLICVGLNAKGHILTWPFAIASSATYAWVFQNAKLFGDAGLQLVFIALAIYAWIQWHRAKIVVEGQSTFSRVSIKHAMQCLFAGIGLFLMITWVLITYTSSDVPYIDALLTAGSLVATYMSAHKWLESWLVWGLIDIAYVTLYIYKDLYLTALLYSLFIALCVWGWQQWSRQMNPVKA
jgi:nicotinamide mononucleotide transporter